MNEKQIRKIIPELKKRNKLMIERYNRNIPIFRRISYFLMAVYGVFMIFIISLLIDCINEPYLFEALVPHIFLTPMIGGMITFRWYLNSRKIKVTNKKAPYIDIWRNLRQQYITDTVFYFLLGILLFTFGDINSTATLFIVLTFAFYFVFVSTIVAIRINPKLIINGLLNQVGSIASFLSVISYLYFAYCFISNFDFFNYDTTKLIHFSIFTIGIILLIIIQDRIFVRITGGVTFTQAFAIRTINPKDLIVSLRKERKIIEDKGEALKILQKIEKNNSPGVQAEILKLIIKENTYKKRKFWGYLLTAIIGILAFISTAVGKAFIQDLIYHGYLKELLCKFFETFC